MRVVVVSHTHWDREWYQPLGRMRQRLARLVDEVLDAGRSGQGKVSFLLDGQSIVLEDYLAMRPERADDVREALRSGRVDAGPWYVLPDELIPSGEALIRNLQEGRESLARLTGSSSRQDGTPLVPPVLYCPDAFGHPAALPDLALGFGLRTIILWRGHGGSADPQTDTVHWRGRDGRAVLLHHLTPSGYELGANLPADVEGAERRWKELRAVLEPRSALGVTLLPNGADHHAMQKDLELAIETMAKVALPHTLTAAGIRDFVRMLEEMAAGGDLPEVAGERRDSYGYTWTLQGTFSSRTAQKRANARAERMLLRESEPWLALALARGMVAEPDAARASLSMAWRTLLSCHPHDTLCGCSVDLVAEEMDVRLASATAQGRGVRDDALAALLGADPDAARGNRERWRPALVLRNAAARPRSGVVEVELLATVADEPVGPGSADGVRRARELARQVTAAEAPECGLVMQLLGSRLKRERIEPSRHYPDNDIVRAWRAVVMVTEPIAGVGLRVVPLDGSPPSAGRQARSSLPSATAEEGDDGVLRLGNGEMTVGVSADGRVAFGTNSEPHTVADLLGIDWVRDVGDLYTHQPSGDVRESWDYLGGRVRHAGPLRAELTLRYSMRVPRSRKSGRDVQLPVRLTLRLDAGSPLLHVRVNGTNRARDHRLRLRFRTGVSGGSVAADAAFAPVPRLPVQAAASASEMESPPATAPLHRYLTLAGDRAVTLVSDGLAEYEATPSGDILVTLVRAVGALSRGTLSSRPGHAGWPAATPGAQCLGSFAANFALLLHSEGSDRESITLAAEQAAEDALVPVTGTTWRWLLSSPDTGDGFELIGHGLVLRAIIPTATGVQLRCVNLLDREAEGRWRLPPGLEAIDAWHVRLDGHQLKPLHVTNGEVAFRVAPHETFTVALDVRAR